MTPTLRGRWQTRLLLFLTIGLGITAVFGRLYRDLPTAFSILGYMLVFGLVWDMVYFWLQSRRWDHDWSPALYVAGAVWEAIVMIGCIKFLDLPGVPRDFGVLKFLLQYGAVWAGTLLFAFGPMRILFPRWRFRGGQWL